jgi:lycopene cyclase domain-containing protein
LIYLYLNLFTIFFPLVLSFDRRVAFYRKWAAALPAVLLTLVFFVPWDAFFTRIGVWGFTPKYLLGISLFGLPLEEVLFFITVPYACLFIYETLNTYLTRDWLAPFAKVGFWFSFFAALLAGFLFHDRWYTACACLGLALLLLIHFALFRYRFFGRFLMAYLVHLVPFLLVNGVLTYLPVVWYNNSENVGIRLGTIPIEDTAYSMLMLIVSVTTYEWLAGKLAVPTAARLAHPNLIPA